MGQTYARGRHTAAACVTRGVLLDATYGVGAIAFHPRRLTGLGVRHHGWLRPVRVESLPPLGCHPTGPATCPASHHRCPVHGRCHGRCHGWARGCVDHCPGAGGKVSTLFTFFPSWQKVLKSCCLTFRRCQFDFRQRQVRPSGHVDDEAAAAGWQPHGSNTAATNVSVSAFGSQADRRGGKAAATRVYLADWE